MAKRTKAKTELRGKARLQSEIVEAVCGLKKIGVMSDKDLGQTTAKMLGLDARINRRVFATDQLTAEEIATFEGAMMHPRHDEFDAEIKGWKA